MKDKLHAVILSGGIGSRFWPLSRETTPKQLLSVVEEESLLKSTIKRLSPLIDKKNISIVTNIKQSELIKVHLNEGLKSKSKINFIDEPFGRNTAPAIGLAAALISKKDKNAVLCILPSDHLIKDKKAFQNILQAAKEVALTNRLVTFGIKPTEPHTGYGYIKAKKKSLKKIKNQKVSVVEKFVEKPNISKAKKYLSEGNYFWNSGIFVFKAETILSEIEKYSPKMYKSLMKIKEGADIEKEYKKIENISIDYAVFEKTKIASVIEANFNWSDVGSFSTLPEVMEKDKKGNVIKGRVLDFDSSGSVIISDKRLVATIGLENMIVVDTEDATLVCPMDRSQDVKMIAPLLKKKKMKEYELHRTVTRPWGTYTVLEESDTYKIKKIVVRAGQRLSLQSHKFRSEHWVVTKGVATVICGNKTFKVKTNESTFIPKKTKHRLENKGRADVEIIEVQNGSYVGEDDIKRFDDDYKRK